MFLNLYSFLVLTEGLKAKTSSQSSVFACVAEGFEPLLLFDLFDRDEAKDFLDMAGETAGDFLDGEGETTLYLEVVGGFL